MCTSAMIDEVEEEPGRVLFQHAASSSNVPTEFLHLITIRNFSPSPPLALPSHPSEACGVQTGRARCPASWRATADSQALLEGIGSVRFLLVTAHHSPQSPTHFPLSQRARVCVCARTRECCVLVYLRVQPCLQQLSEIIRLYHVRPHVGIFPAVPERLFCFLRLASARRNAAY